MLITENIVKAMAAVASHYAAAQEQFDEAGINAHTSIEMQPNRVLARVVCPALGVTHPLNSYTDIALSEKTTAADLTRHFIRVDNIVDLATTTCKEERRKELEARKAEIEAELSRLNK